MKIKIKKDLLKKINRLIENKSGRGEKLFNNAMPNFFGNFGSVKSKFDEDEDDELPVKSTPQMATQLSIDEPPVDDPDYIPASIKELEYSAARIAKEVPHKKIEKFYRKLHTLLDSVLDEYDDVDDLNEAIDYSKIHPMHHKAIQQLVSQMVGSKQGNEDAASFIMSNPVVKRYPDVTLADVLDELEKLTAVEEEESEEELSDELADVFVNPPEELEDLSPPEEEKPKERKIIRKTIRTKKDIANDRKKKELTDVDDAFLDEKASDEIEHLLASAYAEFTEMEEYAQTWDWDDYEKEAPYLKVIFNLIKILHQLSYRVMQAKYITKYGGYIYDPEADLGKKEKGGFVLLKQGPTSRPEAEAMLRKIESDFGLNYNNMMKQQNVLKIDTNALTMIIERAMVGIFQSVPTLYAEFMQAVKQDTLNRDLQGFEDDIANDAFGFIANVLAHKYRGESEKLDRDLPTIAITGIFKRCLLDLPAELGIQPKVGISLDTLGKKKSDKTDKTFGFNLLAVEKRFETLRKDPKIAKTLSKSLPSLILSKITETKTCKVTKSGKTYNFEDVSTGLGYELSEAELKKNIQDYVDARISGAQPSFEEEPEQPEVEELVYDEEAEEKEAKARLSKDDYETRRMVDEMQKMISSGDWMHIAPLFGFSGAPGIRQWYLRKPELKFNIAVAGRMENAPAGAIKYMEQMQAARDKLGNNLITLNDDTPGVLDMLIDEITNKGSITTSDQAMIELLEEMKNNIEDLMNLYELEDTYQEVEANHPEELQRLNNTPGGSLLRFAVGSIFDKIIIDIEKSWHGEMSDYLQIKNGLEKSDADNLAYYFTGHKAKPSRGDFSEDKEKLSNAAAAFTDVGMQGKEFFDALKYSQNWLFRTIDRKFKNEVDKDKNVIQGEYFKQINDMIGKTLWDVQIDKKTKKRTFKLDKKLFKVLKELIQGKNGAISAYLDNLAIEQFQQATQKKIDVMKSEKPDLFMENLSKIIKRYI